MSSRSPDVPSTVLDREMGDERPPSDRIAMERARARTERALFGHAEPAQIGRYLILEPIAGGGMGFVYAAYDPELDRQVALKVLHPSRNRDDSHGRLLREARALARLDHPNVVRVHDVLSADGQIVIVMELVEGETLASWEASAPRRWREVVAAYAQAGEGLAAAHELDVIHRDFKPSNAIIGDDGRVRVLDFGLALLADDQVDAARPSTGGSRSSPLRTASGTIMGTPGYAAPEQLAGGAVTQASDQFSFCVALHRAVEGVAPFPGAAVKQLVASIHSQPPRLASDGRRVPRWLRAALHQGLAADPAQRHASMRALLTELTRPRGWRRWQWPAAAALLIAASAATTTQLVDRSAGLPGCDGGAAELAAVWGPAQRVVVAGRLGAQDAPYAREAQGHVLAGLDAHTEQWGEVHRAACLAHRRGAESGALLDRKMLCLRQRLDETAAAVAVLDRIDGSELSRAIDVVAGMPSPAVCANATRLMTEAGAPAAPALRERVAAVHAQLGSAAALSRAGRADEALRTVVSARAQAEATGHAPVIAEAQLAQGRALLARGDHRAATPVLRDAMRTALASNLTRIAVEAAARRIYSEGVASGALGQLDRELDYVESMSRSVVDDRFVRPLLLNNIGVAYMAGKRSDEALRYFQLARDALHREASPDLELLVIDQNIAMLTPDATTRASLARGVWLRRTAALGEHHLATLDALVAYAWFSADARAAYDLITPACAGYRQMHPTLIEAYADCETTRGLFASELDDRAVAEAAYAAAIAAIAAATDSHLIVKRDLAIGELAVLRGSRAQAIEHLGRVIEARGRSERWWVRKEALQAELGLGLVAAATGDRAAARHLETAANGFAEITRINQSIVYRLRLARARRALDTLASGSRERSPTPRH
jgi:eukaryotic-like serine/threonine-protein kinase